MPDEMEAKGLPGPTFSIQTLGPGGWAYACGNFERGEALDRMYLMTSKGQTVRAVCDSTGYVSTTWWPKRTATLRTESESMTDEAIDLAVLEIRLSTRGQFSWQELTELLRRARRLERATEFLHEHGASLILACERYPGTREALAALMKEIGK